MTLTEVQRVSRHIVAANIRARMGWHGHTGTSLASIAGCSQNAMSMKLRGESPFTSDELDALAREFGMPDPGGFYHPPEGWGEPPAVRNRGEGLLPCTFGQPPWSEPLFGDREELGDIRILPDRAVRGSECTAGICRALKSAAA